MDLHPRGDRQPGIMPSSRLPRILHSLPSLNCSLLVTSSPSPRLAPFPIAALILQYLLALRIPAPQ